MLITQQIEFNQRVNDLKAVIGLGVPSEFGTFTERARAVPRAWSPGHGAAQGGTVIFRYRLIIVRSICSPMIPFIDC